MSSFPRSLGYSIPDPDDRKRWTSLLMELDRYVREEGLEEEIAFHGTSSFCATKILKSGMKPSCVKHAVYDRTDAVKGSYWGSLASAAAYAEDRVAEKNPGSSPVILAVTVDRLRIATDDLLPDGATYDFPMDGLTSLSDPAILKKWSENYAERTWLESFRDLGAFVAMHSNKIGAQDIEIIDDLQKLKEMCRKIEFRC